MSVYNGTSTGAQTLAVAQVSVVVAEVFLNQRESFRAEIIQRRGKAIVAISRWKKTSGLTRRTGSAIEFAAHRTAGILKLLGDLQRILETGVHTSAVEVFVSADTTFGSAAPCRRLSALGGSEGWSVPSKAAAP